MSEFALRLSKILKTCSFLILLLSVNPLSPVDASSKVEILSHTGFMDFIGLYHVVGEVLNLGNIDVFVHVTASFYDSNDRFISNSTSSTLISVVLAGRRAPFDIALCTSSDIISCQQQSETVNHYRLGIALNPYPGLLPLWLQILSNSSLSVDPFDPLGRGHVNGLIENSGPQRASSVKVVATFYNSTGGVVAVALSGTSPESIGSDDQAIFDIVLDGDKVPLVRGYSLSAQSAEYGLISKFPFNTALSLNAPSTTVGAQTTLTAVIRDENRQPIPGGEIDFFVYQDGQWKTISSSTTNNEGLATATYQPALPGRFPVRATYNGDTNHSRSGEEVTLLVVEQSPVGPRADLVALIFRYVFVFPVATAVLALSYLLLKKRPARKPKKGP